MTLQLQGLTALESLDAPHFLFVQIPELSAVLPRSLKTLTFRYEPVQENPTCQRQHLDLLYYFLRDGINKHDHSRLQIINLEFVLSEYNSLINFKNMCGDVGLKITNQDVPVARQGTESCRCLLYTSHAEDYQQ